MLYVRFPLSLQYVVGDFFDPLKLWATERERNGKDSYQPPTIIRPSRCK